MSMRGIAPLFAAALLGGGGAHVTPAHAAVAHRVVDLTATQLRLGQGTGGQRTTSVRAAVRRPATASPGPSPTSSFSPSAVTGAVLQQDGSRKWTTTVVLSHNSAACTPTPSFWLETTSPDRTISKVTRSGVRAASNRGKASSCRFTVTFTGLRRVPETAALVVNQAGSSSTIPLIVHRQVTLYYYLGIPAIVGAIMALIGLFVSILMVKIYRPGGGRMYFWQLEFWRHPLTASGAWALNDSWATNITTGFVVVGTVLGAATATSSLFPGVTLTLFSIVNIIVGAIVVAAPIVFAIAYSHWIRKNPGVTADASLTLPSDAAVPLRDQAAIITVPSGASISMLGGGTVQRLGDAGPPELKIKVGGAVQVPPGTGIRVQAGGVMSLPGTSDITVRPGSTLECTADTEDPWSIAAGDLAPVPAPVPAPAPAPQPDQRIDYPATVILPGGARISVVGVADVQMPHLTVIRTSLTGQESCWQKDRVLQVPQGSSMIAANMAIVLLAAFVTMFGIGAELGIAGVLAYGLSDASHGWREVMLIAILAVAVFVLLYAVTAIQALADPQPGSSLSAAPGTSFTL